jgi:hypothetical protein
MTGKLLVCQAPGVVPAEDAINIPLSLCSGGFLAAQTSADTTPAPIKTSLIDYY